MTTDFTNKIIIITAPSGAGKTSITKYLLRSFPWLAFSTSATTRSKRAHEVDGKDYYFLDADSFREKIKANNFVEWEMVYEGNYYGTLKTELERIWAEGKCPLLDIDVKGALHVQQQFPETSLSLFINPPTIEELQKRLEKRGTESEENIKTRMNKAQYELSFKDQFNKIILNEHFETACMEAANEIKTFLQIPA